MTLLLILVIDSGFEIYKPLHSNTNIFFRHNISRVIENITNVLPCIVMGNNLLVNKIENYTGNGWNEYYGYRTTNKKIKIEELNVYVGIYLDKHSDILNILQMLHYVDMGSMSSMNLDSLNDHKNTTDLKDKRDKKLDIHINYINNPKEKEFTIDRKKITDIGPVSLHAYDDVEALYQGDITRFLLGDCSCTHYFFIGKECVINNPRVILDLIAFDKSIISPFLKRDGTAWTNFWGDIDANGYYKRSFDYFEIIDGRRKGCWNVPYITGVYLIKRAILEEHPKILGNKHIDIDLRICSYFRENNVFMYVSNLENYGYIC